METSEIEQKIIEILKDQSGINEIISTSSLQSLGFDSLNTVDIELALEDEYNLETNTIKFGEILERAKKCETRLVEYITPQIVAEYVSSKLQNP